jgi:hypothetical protein
MNVTDEDLGIARGVAAEVVRQMGEKYWPIFEMLDAEWERRRERSARLSECLTTEHAPLHRRPRPSIRKPLSKMVELVVPLRHDY